MEGYLNLDSGTLNPFRHGEVFVLEDGMETDMDLGTYERMLNENLGKMNFTTSGQIFTRVLDRERHGGYLGRDVQMIPHVTGEVKNLLRQLAAKSQADVVFIEVGGTVGDYENGYFIEALRELAYEEGDDSVCVVALTYVMEPKSLGEQKSKAAQLGLRQVMQAGLVPHIIACRCPSPVTEKVRQKISMFSNVPLSRVVSMHDVESIYLVPEMLREAGMDREVLTLLRLHDRVNQRMEDQARRKWVKVRRKPARAQGKDRHHRRHRQVHRHPRCLRFHRQSPGALLRPRRLPREYRVDRHRRNLARRGRPIRTPASVTSPNASRVSTASSSPAASATAASKAKSNASALPANNKIPFLGICLGFQMAVIEFARNVCKLPDANSTEFEPACENPVIDILPEQKKVEGLGGNMRLGGKDIELTPGSLISSLYDNSTIKRLRFRHRYEVDPRYFETLKEHGLIFSGRHPTQPIMQMLELPARCIRISWARRRIRA